MKRLDEIKMPNPEEAEARETKFRIGAHHAVTRLAEALEEMTTVEECRQLADLFADAIGQVRNSDGEFDLYKLIADAKRAAKTRST